MNRDFEAAPQSCRQVQQGHSDDEVSRRGDGQEFAQAFEDAEQNRRERIIHRQHSQAAGQHQAQADAAKTQQVVAEDVARGSQQLTLTGQRDALESKG